MRLLGMSQEMVNLMNDEEIEETFLEMAKSWPSGSVLPPTTGKKSLEHEELGEAISMTQQSSEVQSTSTKIENIDVPIDNWQRRVSGYLRSECSMTSSQSMHANSYTCVNMIRGSKNSSLTDPGAVYTSSEDVRLPINRVGSIVSKIDSGSSPVVPAVAGHVSIQELPGNSGSDLQVAIMEGDSKQ